MPNFMFPLLALQDPQAAAQLAAASQPPPSPPGAGVGQFVPPQPTFDTTPMQTQTIPAAPPLEPPPPAPLPAAAQPPAPAGAKTQQALASLASVQRSQQPQRQAPSAPAPPQGRGLGVAPQGGQTIAALMAALQPGAQGAIPSLGSLIRGR